MKTEVNAAPENTCAPSLCTAASHGPHGAHAAFHCARARVSRGESACAQGAQGAQANSDACLKRAFGSGRLVTAVDFAPRRASDDADGLLADCRKPSMPRRSLSEAALRKLPPRSAPYPDPESPATTSVSERPSASA